MQVPQGRQDLQDKITHLRLQLQRFKQGSSGAEKVTDPLKGNPGSQDERCQLSPIASTHMQQQPLLVSALIAISNVFVLLK